MSFIKQEIKDYNLPFSTPEHQKNFHTGAVSYRVEQNNLVLKDNQNLRFPPSSGLSHQNNQIPQQKLHKMNSCYFQDSNSEKENKPHLISSATASQNDQKKSFSRTPQTQAIQYNLVPGKANIQGQNTIDSSQYYLPPSSIMTGNENKDHYKKFIDFSQNSMQLNNPSSTANSSQMNNSQLKQNESIQQNQSETVKVKQYLISQQNSLKKYVHQQILQSQKDTNFQAIKRNILGDILNNQHQTHELISRKITSSASTTPRNGSTTPSNTFKCDQFNESLNRILKLKDKYSYIDKRQNEYDQQEKDLQQQVTPSIQHVQSEGMLAKHLLARTNQSSATSNLLIPIENNVNYSSNSQNISRVSYIDQDPHSQRVLDRVQSTKHLPDQQVNMSILHMKESACPSRGQSPFTLRQSDQQQKTTDPNRQYKVEVQKYKQYFIESAIESERLNREQENLKDENEKLRFRLKELLRISQIQTGNLHAKHNNSHTPVKQQDSRDTFPRDQSVDRISSHSSLSSQQQQNQNLEKKRGKSQYIGDNDNLNMKKELEECVLLLESGRQKIDSLKYSITEKEQLIKQSKDYTNTLESKVISLEKENTELKNIIEGMKRQKSQSANLIEQICNDGYQEHLNEQIIKQFSYKFVDFLENQKKLIIELTKENIQNMEEIGYGIFKLAQNLEIGQQKKTNQDLNAYRIQLLRFTKDELNKLKQEMMKKLNLTEEQIVVETDLNLDKYIIEKPLQQNSGLCNNCQNNESDLKNGKSKNQDSFQQYLVKNTGRAFLIDFYQIDSLNLSQTSIRNSESKNNKQLINCNANISQSKQKTAVLYEEQEILQMILLQAQSLEHIFKEQQ